MLRIILLARKPLSENSIAENVLKHGSGGINIEGTRIPTGESLGGGAYSQNPGPRESDNFWVDGNKSNKNTWRRMDQDQFKQPSGRWAANLIFQHKPECQKVGTVKVKGSKPHFTRRQPGDWEDSQGMFSEGRQHFVKTKDGTETADQWECVDGCPVKELSEQSGYSSSPVDGGICKRTEDSAWKERGGIHTPGRSHRFIRPGDHGTAARYFKQVQKK